MQWPTTAGRVRLLRKRSGFVRSKRWRTEREQWGLSGRMFLSGVLHGSPKCLVGHLLFAWKVLIVGVLNRLQRHGASRTDGVQAVQVNDLLGSPAAKQPFLLLVPNPRFDLLGQVP